MQYSVINAKQIYLHLFELSKNPRSRLSFALAEISSRFVALARSLSSDCEESELLEVRIWISFIFLSSCSISLTARLLSVKSVPISLSLDLSADIRFGIRLRLALLAPAMISLIFLNVSPLNVSFVVSLFFRFLWRIGQQLYFFRNYLV